MSRRHDGVALLVAGYGATSASPLDAAALHTLGQIGEVLLATGATWQIRRLTSAAGERYAPDRATLKRHLDELATEKARVAVLVIVGTIVEVNGEPALVSGSEVREYPEDATLPLAWISERLGSATAGQVVIVLSGRGEGSPGTWFARLRTSHQAQLVAVAKGSPGAPIADTLLAGLCGDALDPRTGTVTMASLAKYLAEHAPGSAVLRSELAETIAQPPPLAGLWDVRRSQLSMRGTRPRFPRGAPCDEDLAGVVLPGRFRIDTLVARGTFGTIYRARQLAVERDVALKVLHAEIDPSSEDGRLFVHEIRSVGRIDHANVVRIYQADITPDGRLFFAMELLPGEDLQTLASRERVPRARAVELVRQLLAGLGAAHDAGLVHADIKPANAIVVPRDGDERVVLVDFGLSRLRSPDRPAESAGGTPAYMAPEQLMEGRVDARSDLFSCALVLVHLLTGWRRPNAMTLTPPLDEIVDEDLRRVLGRALATDPANRYQTARELVAALDGSTDPSAGAPIEPIQMRPFHHLAPLTEADRDRLSGRQVELGALTEQVLFRRSVIYTAASGVGKTSLLRAGLIPRLEALGVHAVYVRCRGNSTAAIACAIMPDATTIAEAIALHARSEPRKLVLVLDQLEAALGDVESDTLVPEILGFDQWPRDADVSVVLGIREDHLARLVAKSQEIEPGMPIMRLPPLSVEGARDAIVSPLTEKRLAIEPELLEMLLGDLARAGAAIGPTMGWGAAAAVYPPHLQLACSALYDALAPGEGTLTATHYKRLGGFEAIVGEYLERVLDTELADGRDVIARDVFLTLVTAANERAVRSEAELLAIASVRHTPHEVKAVLEALRTRGLLVRVRSVGSVDEHGWELVHDSLVPRVLAWIDRKDLARRRAVELVRYHVRRSRPSVPSLLGRAELRELRPFLDAVVELDAEFAQRGATEEGAWTPARLVAHSRRVLRRRVTGFVALFASLVLIATGAFYASHRERVRAAREQALRAHDLGRFVLSIEPFDTDAAQAMHPVRLAPTQLSWAVYAPDVRDPQQPGALLDADHVRRGNIRAVAEMFTETIEARGGAAFLVVARLGCTPSTIPLRQLPGYALREASPPTLHVRVPTCAASRSGMIELAGGAFLMGGPGEPPSADMLADHSPAAQERRVTLPAFAIDRTEVTNTAFSIFAGMGTFTGVGRPSYPSADRLSSAVRPFAPVGGIDWFEARAFCRFYGKALPTSQQWTRALRGLEQANPMPRRNFPWGAALPVEPTARLATDSQRGPSDVGTHPGDVTPEGIVDLAGNVQEWTATVATEAGEQFRTARGGSWSSTREELVEYMAIENPRAVTQHLYSLGLRCVMPQ